jgi:hypothetical protein
LWSDFDGTEVLAAAEFFGNQSKTNKHCHKNAVVLSDSRATDSLMAAPKADISDREPWANELDCPVCVSGDAIFITA